MSLYPPLFFNRIVVQSISSDFKRVKVKVVKSIFNKNPQGSIFGGTLFSGTDPYPAVQFWNIFRSRGYDCVAWLKRSEIDYIKPAKSSVVYDFYIPEVMVNKAEAELRAMGRAEIVFEVSGIDKKGQLITKVKSTSVIKIKSGSHLPS